MARPDMNLLVTLDVLLAEGSVAGAARKLGLSPSAMSRALARLRAATGDPLLVRAGRSLVPTPRALELRQRVGPLVEEARAVLGPQGALDPGRLEATFTLRTGDGFVETFGPALIARLGAQAPGVTLRFAAKTDAGSKALRDGTVDLETGLLGAPAGPELRARGLFRDRFVAAVRPGHALARGPVTARGYAAGRHVTMWRPGIARGPVDEALAPLGLQRTAAVMVGGFSAALALVRTSDLIATVPERMTAALRAGLISVPLPLAMPPVTVFALWHPRMEADPAHRWLRTLVREVCAAAHAAPPAAAAGSA